MTATVVEIKESDGWVDLTAAAGLLPGDEINIQNIGSRAVYLETSASQPTDLSGVDYLYAPKANPLTPTPADTESVWANTQDFGTTKLSVADTRIATITDPLLVTAKTIDDLLEVTQGIPTAGFAGFSRLGFAPIEIVFAFHNTGEKELVGDFLASASNNANAMVGTFDIEVGLSAETLTGGTEFTAAETLLFRGAVDIDAKVNPTNTPTYAKFERIYVPANGGSGLETVNDFIMLPGETVFVKLTSFVNIVDGSFSGRFGRG